MHRRSGFTIVELLIVIVVIAILAAISIIAYNGIQQRARDSERVSDISTIQKVLEIYYAENNRYPLRGELQDPVWRRQNLATQDQSIFINPQDQSSTNSIVASGSVVALDKYSYYELPTGIGSGYRMAWKLEADLGKDPHPNYTKSIDR